MKFIFSFLFFLFFFLGIAQEKSIVVVNENGIESNVDSLKYVTEIDFQHYLIQLKNNEIKKGFFQFSVDSIQNLETKKIIYCFYGKKYYQGNILLLSNLQDSSFLLNKNKIQSLENFDNLENLISPLANNGYPFAEIKVQNIEIKDSICNIAITIRPNQLVRIDSLVVKSEEKIEQKLLARLINIYPGDVYNEEKIQNVDEEIRKNLFYTLVKNTEVLFTDQGAQIYFYLKKKSSNLFDGLVGVQQTKEDNKVNLTGALNFRLQNNFQRAESLIFNWKKLPSQTQELAIQAAYPYIIFSNFGVKADLSIYRQDTTFISTRKKAGISYRVSLNEEIGLFIENSNSFDQKAIDNLSNNSSIYKAAGASYTKNNFESQINPKSGYSFSFAYAVGNRTASGDDSQSDIQHKSELEIKKAIPIYKGVNIFIKIHEKFQSLGGQFQNEMIRFGGNKTLRGFDELSIEATSMVTASTSLRYFLDRNTNVYLFYDQSWYEKNGRNEYVTDLPYGIGAGFSFITNSGMFSFNYALGSQFDNPLNFRSGKIHFGLISQF